MKVDRARGKGNLVLEKRDYLPPSIEDKVEEQAEGSRYMFLDNMDAIAYGVQAWFEENTGYSTRVTETTVEIARALGMPEGEIKKWVSSRSIRDTERGKVVKFLLERLQGSSPADRVDDKRHLIRNQPMVRQ